MTCRHGVPIYVWCDTCDRLDAGWDQEWHRTSARRLAGLVAVAAFASLGFWVLVALALRWLGIVR